MHGSPLRRQRRQSLQRRAPPGALGAGAASQPVSTQPAMPACPWAPAADAAAAEGLALKVYKAVWGRTPTINEVLSTTLTQARAAGRTRAAAPRPARLPPCPAPACRRRAVHPAAHPSALWRPAQAGFASSSAVWKAVMATVGRTDEASVILRRSWLLRNHVVGTILSAPRNSGCQYLSSCTVVDPRTREQKQHFCCGAWEQAAKFAGSPAAIKASIADLKRFFCSRF